MHLRTIATYVTGILLSLTLGCGDTINRIPEYPAGQPLDDYESAAFWDTIECAGFGYATPEPKVYYIAGELGPVSGEPVCIPGSVNGATCAGGLYQEWNNTIVLPQVYRAAGANASWYYLLRHESLHSVLAFAQGNADAGHNHPLWKTCVHSFFPNAATTQETK